MMRKYGDKNVDITGIQYYQNKEGREVEPSHLNYFLRPVRLAAILPTFRPGGACLLTVLGLPGD